MPSELFDGPFPANVPEADRFRQPSPTLLETEREQSGGLSDSSDPVVPTPTPFKNLRTGRE